MPERELPPISPTVSRRWLAQEIRRLREAAGLKQSDVAKRLRCNTAKVGHMESTRNTISGPDLEIMLPFLGVPPERIDWYLELADAAKKKGWWDGNRAIPDWFSLYIGLEWGASEIREWDLGYIPGLLQTREYADIVIRDGITATERHFQEQTDLRLHRQTALDRAEDPLKLHAIVDEAALRRCVGGPQVMSDQLLSLVTANEHSQVTVQVIPFESGTHRGQLGSFTWMGFPRDDDDGVIYTENQEGALYLEEHDEVQAFLSEFEHLRRQALPAEESDEFIRLVAKELFE